MTLVEVLLAMGIGLAAGVLGGLAGIGGSMVMLPGLALLLGYSDEAQTEHHLFMAAAMVVNVVVAVPAAARHARAGSVRWDLARALLLSMTLAIVAGVLLSNELRGAWLRFGLAVFIAGYCIVNLVRAFKKRREIDPNEWKRRRGAVSVSGGLSGLVAGLLGLGGGVVLVPMLQVFCKVRLRIAIATSLTVMPLTAGVGAAVKMGTLGGHGLLWVDAVMLVLAMAPGAALGGHLGAMANHRLPLFWVRVVVSVLLLIVAARLAVVG